MPSHGHAEAPVSLSLDRSKPTGRSVRADWSAYATAYDLLSEHNPEYLALMRDFEDFLASMEAPRLIYDIGGGTGNYTRIAARTCPDSEIHLVEPDIGMMEVAQAKLSAFENVTFENLPLEKLDAPGTADLIICVHALYAMPSQEQRFVELRRLLRPGGWLYLIDLGRFLDLADWRGYLLSHLRREHGLLGALRIVWQGREIARQNAAILKAQKSGAYWTHTEAEIAQAAKKAGFEILRQQSVYRDYSDLLVCRAMT